MYAVTLNYEEARPNGGVSRLQHAGFVFSTNKPYIIFLFQILPPRTHLLGCSQQKTCCSHVNCYIFPQLCCQVLQTLITGTTLVPKYFKQLFSLFSEFIAVLLLQRGNRGICGPCGSGLRNTSITSNKMSKQKLDRLTCNYHLRKTFEFIFEKPNKMYTLFGDSSS